MTNIGYFLTGIAAGIFGGLFGIGGATIVIPILVMYFQFSQHQAQGTVLAAMVPPIGLLAAWQYYARGNVKIAAAALIAAGFFFGGYLGAQLAGKVPDIALKRAFGILLLFVAVRLISSK